MKVVEESAERPRNERKKVGGLADHQLYARMIVEYIGLADLLETHNTPPNSFLDSNFRDTTSFFRVLPSPR